MKLIVLLALAWLLWVTFSVGTLKYPEGPCTWAFSKHFQPVLLWGREHCQ